MPDLAESILTAAAVLTLLELRGALARHGVAGRRADDTNGRS